MLEKIDIFELGRALLKRWWVILIFTLVFGGAAYGYSKYIQTKQYASVGKMYIDTYRGANDEATASIQILEHESTDETEKDDGDEKTEAPVVVVPQQNVSEQRDVSVINASQRSVPTCIEVMKSTKLMNMVREETGLGKKYSASYLKNNVIMSSANDTEVLEIRIECGNQKEAKMLVDGIMKVAERELPEIVDVSTAMIIDEGTESNNPISPNIRLQSIIGALLGFLIGAAIIIVLSLMDNRVKSEEDLQKYGNIPVIGVIPEII